MISVGKALSAPAFRFSSVYVLRINISPTDYTDIYRFWCGKLHRSQWQFIIRGILNGISCSWKYLWKSVISVGDLSRASLPFKFRLCSADKTSPRRIIRGLWSFAALIETAQSLSPSSPYALVFIIVHESPKGKQHLLIIPEGIGATT